MFFWAVDEQHPQLETHNLFVTGDYQQSFDHIFRDLTAPDDPTFYIHAPVRMDPSQAPQDQDTLIVVVPTGHIDDAKPQDWPGIQKRIRQVVLQRLTEIGIPTLEKHIKFEVCTSPHDWQAQYNLAKGATHGLSHDLLQMGYLRPRNRHSRYRNLYFVGASTHPGTGLPVVLVSARLVAERILREAGIPRTHTIDQSRSKSTFRPVQI
jgi:phytoene desaturase